MSVRKHSLLGQPNHSKRKVVEGRKAPFIEECVVSLHAFFCLHMAPVKCRMQSATPRAQITLPVPVLTCPRLSAPVSSFTKCPVALTLGVNIHSFHRCHTPRLSCELTGTSRGQTGSVGGVLVAWQRAFEPTPPPSDLPTGFTVFSRRQFINRLYTTSPAGSDTCVE